MKNKTVILILSILAVAMYTTAVINFCMGDVLGGLPENKQTLLKRQHQAMHDYREALRQRIRIDAEAANLKVDINDPDEE